MKHIKKFESWEVFSDSGDFKITYIPNPGENQRSETIEKSSRKEVIKDILNEYPKCKILKIERVTKDGVVDIDGIADSLDEGIVNYESDNIKSFYDELNIKYDSSRFLTMKDIKEVGDEYNIEVVSYNTFYDELPEDMRRNAPPRNAPCFALVNPITKKARVVINVPKVDSRMFNHIYHMLKHENIHIEQHSRSGGKGSGEGMDVKNQKEYFSNKEEVMAFSQSIVDMLMNNNPKTKQKALDGLKFNPLWNDIKNSVNIETLQRYKKYIYLYLEKEFSKK